MSATVRIAAFVLAVETVCWGIAIADDGPIKQAVLNNLDRILGGHMAVLGLVAIAVLFWRFVDEMVE